MPSPIVHHLSEREVIIGFDPSGEYMLTGRTSTKFGSDIHELYRLRWDRDRCAFIRSRRHPKIRSSKVGAFFSEDFFTGFDWWEDRDAEAADVSRVTHVKRYVSAYVTDLKKAAQLACKSDVDDQLLAVTVDGDGVHVRSLGRVGIGCSVERACDSKAAPPDTGLGTIVVYAPVFKVALTAAKGQPTFAVSYTGLHHDPVLRIGTVEIWTVNRHAEVGHRREHTFTYYPIAEAIKRARAFASKDKARVNLRQLLIEPYANSSVRISASDGAAAHVEVVDCPERPQIPRAFTLPIAFAAKVKGVNVGLSFDGDVVHAQVDGLAVSIDTTASPTFPPVSTVVASARACTTDVAECDSTAVLDLLGGAAYRVYVRLAGPKEVHMWDVVEELPVDAYIVNDGRWVCAANQLEAPPRSRGRAVLVDAARLAAALESMQGLVTLHVGRGTNDPLLITTETQTHMLMPREH